MKTFNKLLCFFIAVILSSCTKIENILPQNSKENFSANLPYWLQVVLPTPLLTICLL